MRTLRVTSDSGPLSRLRAPMSENAHLKLTPWLVLPESVAGLNWNRCLVEPESVAGAPASARATRARARLIDPATGWATLPLTDSVPRQHLQLDWTALCRERRKARTVTAATTNDERNGRWRGPCPERALQE